MSTPFKKRLLRTALLSLLALVVGAGIAMMQIKNDRALPPPPKVAAIAAAPKKEAPRELTAEEKRAAEVAAFQAETRNQVTLLAVGGALLLLVAWPRVTATRSRTLLGTSLTRRRAMSIVAAAR